MSVTLVGTDPDAGTTLSYAIDAGPANGALSAVTGNTVTYTPNTNYNGPDSFTFTVSDGSVAPIRATVTITVTEVNERPTRQRRLANVAEDRGTARSRRRLIANDTNGDGADEDRGRDPRRLPRSAIRWAAR